VTTTFERFQRLEYLLVVRIGDYWPATDNFDETFHPGKVSGDVLLYRVDGSEFLGAFAYEATSSDSTVLDEFDGTEDLQEDLAMNMGWAIEKNLEKTIPGTRLPNPLGD
jgi:hypothetical protein